MPIAELHYAMETCSQKLERIHQCMVLARQIHRHRHGDDHRAVHGGGPMEEKVDRGGMGVDGGGERFGATAEGDGEDGEVGAVGNIVGRKGEREEKERKRTGMRAF